MNYLQFDLFYNSSLLVYGINGPPLSADSPHSSAGQDLAGPPLSADSPHSSAAQALAGPPLSADSPHSSAGPPLSADSPYLLRTMPTYHSRHLR